MLLKSKNGYNISCVKSNIENSDIIIIAMHGFLGDKESSCISLLEEKVKEKNIGLIKFDWPAHGESMLLGDKLTIKNCLSDLNEIVKYVKSINKTASIVAFATSFGGYLALLYNYYYPDIFDKIILRSPAIKMYEVLTNNILTLDMKKQLKEKNYFYHGFDKKIKITKEFVNELKDNNVFDLYENKILDNIYIIHGTLDDTVFIDDSILFCKLHKCILYKIEGADHRYKKEGELDKVINICFDIL